MSTQLTTDSPHEALLQLLLDNRPHSLLCLSDAPVPAIEQYCQQHPECQLDWQQGLRSVSELSGTMRYELAVVADQLEHMEKEQASQLLGTLRNLYSNAIVLLLNPDELPEWHINDLYGLGFHKLQTFEQKKLPTIQRLELYSYDIATYNHVRTWNNPKYWANPENFGKYWW